MTGVQDGEAADLVPQGRWDNLDDIGCLDLMRQGPDSIENFELEFWLEKQLEIPF